MSEEKKNEDFEVGYGRPPKEHRFKKGVSGNPRGRPKRKSTEGSIDPFSLRSMPTNQFLIEEIYRPVTIREDGKVKRIPLLQAIYKKMGVDALNGNRSIQRYLAEQVEKIEKGELDVRCEHMKSWMEYKTVWERRIEDAKASGRAPPDPIPHPDDVIIDFIDSTATICGPLTKQGREEWDILLARRDCLQEQVTESANDLRRARTSERKSLRFAQWKLWQLQYDRMNDDLPKRYRKDLEDRCWEEGASLPGSQKTREWPGG